MAAEKSDIMQPGIRRNVDMLMSWRGMRHARELAAEMNLPENQVSNKTSGRRRWQIEDLPVLARCLGVEPYVLLLSAGDLATYIAAAEEAATGTGGHAVQASGSTQSITRTIRCLHGGLHASPDASTLVDEPDAHIHLEPVGDLDFYRRRRAETADTARPAARRQVG